MNKNIFLQKSIKEILQNRYINHELVKIAIRSYKKNIKYKAWTEFSIKKNKSDLGILSNDLKNIPFGAKDIMNTILFKTQMGSSIWKNFTPGNNARIIDDLISSGAILVGKTETAEFAVHKLNKTLNPYDISRTPGTSSSGSAVCVANGDVPFSLGTQSAASIIRPASFCGVWGFKPSFGLIPRTGVLKTCDTLDTVGFFTSHQKSLRTVLNVIRLKGKNHPFIYKNIDKKNNKKKNNILIGVLRTSFYENSENFIKLNFDKLINKIKNKKRFTIKYLDWPKKFDKYHEIHRIIYHKSLSYYFQNEYRDKKKISKIMKEIIDEGKKIKNHEYIKALKMQEKFIKEFDRFISKFDCCLTLSTTSSAPLRNEKEKNDPSLLFTLAHIPAIGVPYKLDDKKLPIGFQLISKKWSDYKLLDCLDNLVNNKILSPYSLSSHD